MSAEIQRVDPLNPDPAAIEGAAALLRAGGLVAFPTDTVYGLGADGLNEAAVQRIFTVKGRPSQKGLILHLSGTDMLPSLVRAVPLAAARLIERLTPGPLTLVMLASEVVPDAVCGAPHDLSGARTVAVRWPDHPVAVELIRALGRPVAAPSANMSGAPPPVDAEQVRVPLGEQIQMILDAGTTPLGIPSTLVDVTCEPPRILREGALPASAIAEALL